MAKRGYNDGQYSRCKGYGHRWDDPPNPPGLKPAKPGFIKVFFRCDVCAREKISTINLTTGDSRSHYRGPFDYSEWTASRADWKLIYLQNRARMKK